MKIDKSAMQVGKPTSVKLYDGDKEKLMKQAKNNGLKLHRYLVEILHLAAQDRLINK